MEILKEKTTGLCSECYQTVDSRVIEEDGRVIIEKNCALHGITKGVLETDAAFFKRLISARRNPNPHPLPFRTLMINITHGCNLSCNLCYLPERNKSLDFSLSEIKEAISAYPGYIIAISGGEPTTREDLPEIIRHIRKEKKICSLVTNGVKLADMEYLKSLKDAGLTLMNFSFNGFNEETFLAIENAKLLETKKKALANIKELGGFYVQLSFTMAKGINDDQFGQLIEYSLDNNDFVYQIRARVATGIGKRIGEKDIYLSDFIKLLAKETKIPFGYFIDFWIANDWFPNAFLFDMEYFSFLQDPLIAKRLGYNGKPEGLIHYLSRYLGEKNAVKIMDFNNQKNPDPNKKPNFLFVLFSWPDKNTMDYEEIKGLNLDILTRDKVVTNYWDGVIRNEKFALL